MAALRVACPADAEVAPLAWGLDLPPWTESFLLERNVEPAEAAARLAAGDLDAAVLPSHLLAARARSVELIPGLAAASRGAAGCGLLLHRGPLAELRRATDLSPGHAAGALCELLFAAGGSRIEVHPARGVIPPPGADAVIAGGDIARGLAGRSGWQQLDLGQTWSRLTGLPFVWWAWAARPGVMRLDVYRRLHTARGRGRRALGAQENVLPASLRFRLGNAELAGLRRFWSEASTRAVFPAPTEPRLFSPRPRFPPSGPDRG